MCYSYLQAKQLCCEFADTDRQSLLEDDCAIKQDFTANLEEYLGPCQTNMMELFCKNS